MLCHCNIPLKQKGGISFLNPVHTKNDNYKDILASTLADEIVCFF